ncbi:MAG TPA: hypothetical protein VFZ52_16850 [Chryseolinea sp.]
MIATKPVPGLYIRWSQSEVDGNGFAAFLPYQRIYSRELSASREKTISPPAILKGNPAPDQKEHFVAYASDVGFPAIGRRLV